MSFPCTIDERNALKAVYVGKGSIDQQQKAMGWILRALSNNTSPYKDNERDTNYWLGRKDLADQINKEMSTQYIRTDKNG